jgi:hypothetical protein
VIVKYTVGKDGKGYSEKRLLTINVKYVSFITNQPVLFCTGRAGVLAKLDLITTFILATLSKLARLSKLDVD